MALNLILKDRMRIQILSDIKKDAFYFCNKDGIILAQFSNNAFIF